ncbi:hypothetical protein QN277_019981 [Acacia crassicarpa]|uniref:Glycosyltransferase n=1 Tax=Acacia crassicarpa TaxID=499986 RepID=A0AAE1KE77_9FABA|nr:hypothetical protein QN277_019981 [Acacia crassicarpa]
MESKPHAVLTPYPVQSHINSALKLAKLLYVRGFFITFVNTEFNHKRLLKSGCFKILDGPQDFRFETIPDGLPPPANDTTQDLPSIADSTRKNCLLPFQNLLARLNESASNGFFPPVTCLVSDFTMFFTIDAAEALGIPIVIHFPASAYSLLGIAHYENLLNRGIVPLKDESYLTNGYLEQEIDWIPGMRNIRLKDLPSFVRTTDPNEFFLQFNIMNVEKIRRASAICFNTFDELEGDAVEALSSIFSFPLYTIGFFPAFVSQIQHNNQLLSFKYSLWKEETRWLDWLEHKEPKSVVYVNFGSTIIMSAEQLHEFAWGLANSKKHFLWIIRPDLVNGGSVILSPVFLNETKDRGFIADWCEQEKVLNHPSIGGFLTHCGWNSMTESICAGVPMACWPFFADQQTNCRYACKDWGIGVEIDNNVKREEVEKVVNELMDGEMGKKMRQKVSEWKKIAEQDTRASGSSYMNLEKMIKDVMIKTRN